jgi:type IV pilus assembly protein PilN
LIKVNLAQATKKKQARAATRIALPASVTPILLVVIVLGFAGGGYSWYASLSAQTANLNQQIQSLEQRKTQLEAVIKQDQIYESRKKLVENRVKVIEGLQKNQVSPVLALDQLAEAVQNTKFVWLSSLEQKEAMLSMTGTGTSLNAIADFYTNLYATGYFKNVDLGQTQESSGNFTFSLKCEFAPPRNPVGTPQAPEAQAAAGGN